MRHVCKTGSIRRPHGCIQKIVSHLSSISHPFPFGKWGPSRQFELVDFVYNDNYSDWYPDKDVNDNYSDGYPDKDVLHTKKAEASLTINTIRSSPQCGTCSRFQCSKPAPETRSIANAAFLSKMPAIASLHYSSHN